MSCILHLIIYAFGWFLIHGKKQILRVLRYYIFLYECSISNIFIGYILTDKCFICLFHCITYMIKRCCQIENVSPRGLSTIVIIDFVARREYVFLFLFFFVALLKCWMVCTKKHHGIETDTVRRPNALCSNANMACSFVPVVLNTSVYFRGPVLII